MANYRNTVGEFFNIGTLIHWQIFIKVRHCALQICLFCLHSLTLLSALRHGAFHMQSHCHAWVCARTERLLPPAACLRSYRLSYVKL